MQRDPVEDRAHPVLADAEVEIAAGVVAALEIAAVLDVGEGRFVEVGGAAEQAPTRCAIACSAREADSRVASASLGVKTGKSASQPAGRSPASIDLNSAASLGYALA